MFVSDSNIFPSSKMRIRVTCMNGVEFIGEFSPDMTVDRLKIFIQTKVASVRASLIVSQAESLKDSLYHRLVLVRTGAALLDDKTLQQQGVCENDELLLLRRRLCPTAFEGSSDKAKSGEGTKGPSAENIDKMTADIPRSNTESVTGVSTPSVDFQTELRRILISLLEVSQKLLCLNPEASKIFKQAEEILNEPTTHVTKVDEKELKQLTEMGFPENRARKALHLNKMSTMAAMEWLLQHETDADIDDPLPDMDDGAAPEEPAKEVGATGGRPDSGSSPSCKVTNILNTLRAYRKREFKPNQKALQHLTEMGFDVKDVTDALRITRNDCDAACEWLLSERKAPPEEADEGLETDSPIFKAIMANPTVQLGLNNPRCLLAFIQILEHPHMASQWLNDPETAPLLVQVSRIYHAEKNSEQNKPPSVPAKGTNTSKSSSSIKPEAPPHSSHSSKTNNTVQGLQER